MSHTPLSTDETDVLDPGWLAAPSRRSRGRIALVAALAVLLVFLGGVEAQKRWGPAASSSATSARPASFAGFGTPPSGASSSTTGTAATGPGSTTSTTTPAVIGTLTRIAGRTWTVKDLGGTSHTVRLTASTTLTRPIAGASGRVRTGSSVVVQGTTHGHAVTATAVVLH